MYELLKSAINKILPHGILLKNERILRKLYSLFYRGNQHQCNICGIRLSRFITLSNSDLLCPRCGSASRTRRLWDILQNQLADGMKVLHFSPSKSLSEKLMRIPGINYVTSDYSGEFRAAKKLDIRQTHEPADEYDMIICFHILEHVPEDKKAMQELRRILKTAGTCIIQTPFKEGKTYEDWGLKTDQERAVHFGQKDHVRIYSVAGLKNRLEKNGLTVTVENFAGNQQYGWQDNEIILFARK
jgi:SAM-dependent methyltransferase